MILRGTSSAFRNYGNSYVKNPGLRKLCQGAYRKNPFRLELEQGSTGAQRFEQPLGSVTRRYNDNEEGEGDDDEPSVHGLGGVFLNTLWCGVA